jgi:hypothetical protein
MEMEMEIQRPKSIRAESFLVAVNESSAKGHVRVGMYRRNRV